MGRLLIGLWAYDTVRREALPAAGVAEPVTAAAPVERSCRGPECCSS